MDISKTTQPKSDQQNFDDYGTGGPKTVTIVEVVEGNAEQPVWIHLAEFPGRPYKPSKSMRRVLEFAWGKDTDVYHGRRMTLYGDPTVKFGGSVLGGIKISHLSHIDREKSLSLTETKGKRKPYVVQPLVEQAPAPVAPTVADVNASTDRTQLRQWWTEHVDLKPAIEARVEALNEAGDA
jgi:hypothetical protein